MGCESGGWSRVEDFLLVLVSCSFSFSFIAVVRSLVVGVVFMMVKIQSEKNPKKMIFSRNPKPFQAEIFAVSNRQCCSVCYAIDAIVL
jgi:hypothetical protein